MSLLIFALSFWHWGLAAILIAGAAAAFIYLPGKLGGAVAAVCIAFATATGAYQLGFQARGKLDKSLQLQAELQERDREAIAAKQIAGAASQRAADAEQKSQTLQEQVDDYERQLAANAACLATDSDVRGLQSIGPDNPPQPPRRPFDLRPAGRSPAASQGR